jgi:hypothetical protein
MSVLYNNLGNVRTVYQTWRVRQEMTFNIGSHSNHGNKGGKVAWGFSAQSLQRSETHVDPRVRYCSPLLTKIARRGQILVKVAQYKFHKNPVQPSPSRFMVTDGRTEKF